MHWNLKPSHWWWKELTLYRWQKYIADAHILYDSYENSQRSLGKMYKLIHLYKILRDPKDLLWENRLTLSVKGLIKLFPDTFLLHLLLPPPLQHRSPYVWRQPFSFFLLSLECPDPTAGTRRKQSLKWRPLESMHPGLGSFWKAESSLRDTEQKQAKRRNGVWTLRCPQRQMMWPTAYQGTERKGQTLQR